MSMFIYKGGGGVKNGQNLVYVIKVWPLYNSLIHDPAQRVVYYASTTTTPIYVI